jgi:hypothetical protein
MTRMMAVAVLALAAACGGQGGAPADAPAPQAGAPALPEGVITGGGGPNVFALLGARQQLALTSAQVTSLDSIGRLWSVRNDSLQRQLRVPRERTEIPVVRPVLEQMAVNNDAANRLVENVLNAEQRRIACTLPVVQTDRRGPSYTTAPPPGTTRAGGRNGLGQRARRDTVPGTRMRRGWPWCGAATAADSAG